MTLLFNSLLRKEDLLDHFVQGIFNNPGLIAQELKTPERLWMVILLLNQYEATPTIEEFSKISDLSYGFIPKFANKKAGVPFD